MNQRFHRPATSVGIVVLLGLVPLGCSKANVNKVTGSVKLDGAAVDDAHVRFVPKDDANLGEFGGYTRSDGKFAIEVGGPGMTAKPGKYVVLITKGAGIGVPAAPKNEGDAPPPSVGSLPARYADKEQSPFTVEIKNGTTDLAVFELTSK